MYLRPTEQNKNQSSLKFKLLKSHNNIILKKTKKKHLKYTVSAI